MAGFEVITEVSTLRVCFLCKLLIRRSTLQVESVCNERTLSGKTIKTQSAERRDHRIPEVVFGCSQETKGYAQTALLKNPENGCIVPRVGAVRTCFAPISNRAEWPRTPNPSVIWLGPRHGRRLPAVGGTISSGRRS